MKKEDLLKYVRERYTYDPATGAIRHKGRDRAVKGSLERTGYLWTYIGPAGDLNYVRLHRLAWALYYGRWPSEIDHLNGIKTDNRIENLREVTRTENNMNRVWPWKPNARTGLPGVYMGKEGDFRVMIKKEYFFADKYEAFHCITLLGRMYE